jgi:uncharacterized membrane protein YvbJ
MKSDNKKKLANKKSNKKTKLFWFSVAGFSLFLIIVAFFWMSNQDTPSTHKDLGTCDNPEQAFEETQKALTLLSSNVNLGMESVMHIKEYETAKQKVFKK